MYKKIIFSIIILFLSFYEGTTVDTLCKTRGRFPNNAIPECRGYTMCLMGASGYAKFDLLCPENSTYSHIDNQCTNITSYQCLPDYNCTQEGNFVNPSSENCSSYIACVKDLRDITTARLISCQSKEVFSPTESICVNETLYLCNFNTESPKVLQVSVDHFPSISRNFSLNNGACDHTLSAISAVFIVVLIDSFGIKFV